MCGHEGPRVCWMAVAPNAFRGRVFDRAVDPPDLTVRLDQPVADHVCRAEVVGAVAQYGRINPVTVERICRAPALFRFLG